MTIIHLTPALKRIAVLEDLLAGVKEDLPLRWIPCEKCGGFAVRTRHIGEEPNAGMGPTHVPKELEVPCGECRDGWVSLEWHEEGYENGVLNPGDE